MVRPRRGEFFNLALWFCGEDQRQKAEKVLITMIYASAEEYGMVLGPVAFEVAKPDDLRITGKPPEREAECLIASAQVYDLKGLTADEAGFIANLEPSDLDRLRKATIKAWRKSGNPGRISRDHVDQTIAQIGPSVAVKATLH